MVESYIMVRIGGIDVDQDHWGPRVADLAPYSLHWEDVTSRRGVSALMDQEPRIMVIRGRMSNSDAVAMSSDNKLWMIESRQYDPATGEETTNNRDDPYSAAERTTRINQLATFTDFPAAAIETWWTPDKTRRQVAKRLQDYLRTLDINA